MNDYESKKIEKEKYTLIHGDSCVELKNIADDSIDFSIFSPPFAELYQFSSSERDLSNCNNMDTFLKHFKIIVQELLRVIKSGRLVACHCMDLTTNINKNGFLSVIDFGGDLIRLFQNEGFIYHSAITIPKENPLLEAIRTHNIQLLYKQYCKDSSLCRPALPDRLLVFRKNGINNNPINRKYNVNDKEQQEYWKKIAYPIWYDIKQTNTLNRFNSKDNETEKHISCLQLDIIENAINLWTNENEIVLTPFLGVGSEIYQALKMNRRGLGIELKESYFNQAVKNCEMALKEDTKENDFIGELF